MFALLFGSISTLADTSELQRSAFNQAFSAHGLAWEWDRETYRSLITSNGGQDRITEYARTRGQEVDARAIHETKSKNFQDALSAAPLTAREGVADTIAAARDAEWKVALVTSTSRANIAALLHALAGELGEKPFDAVVDLDDVEAPKPDPAAYTVATARLGVDPAACVAIEDNVGGTRSATAAGVPCVAFPNENTAAHDFGPVPVMAPPLLFDELSRRAV